MRLGGGRIASVITWVDDGIAGEVAWAVDCGDDGEYKGLNRVLEMM